MFDIGWTELVIIGVVALIVIGPRDLPEMFRTLGRFTAKARSMSRDFSRAMEMAAKESGVSDVAKDLKDATSARNMGLSAVKDAASKFEKWDPLKTATAYKAPAPNIAAPPAPAVVTAAAQVAGAQVAAASTAIGPETAALAEKVKARKAITTEAAQKLRAVNAGAAVAEPAATPVKRAARLRPKKPAEADKA